MRALVKDPDKIASAALFGTKLEPVSIRELSNRTGISEATLRRYRKRPAGMTVENLAQICKARGLEADRIGEIVKVYRG